MKVTLANIAVSKARAALSQRAPFAVTAAVVGLGVLLFPEPPRGQDGEWGRSAEAGSCPKGMVTIRDKFCIDMFEAHTVEIDRPRTKRHVPKVVKKHSPYKPIEGKTVMAVSERGKVPQGHISREEAEQACFNAGKRLCTNDEWLEACKGKKATKYPYGEEREDGACNDRGVSGFNLLYGPGNNTPPESSAYTKEHMNDPRLNQIEGTVAKTGSFTKCKNGFKVYDMVGNLHEWTSDKAGTFRGGYYLDTSINGEGCDYRTTAHDGKYFDYSTGFRCCFGGAEQARLDKERKVEAEKDKAAKKPREKDKTAEAPKKKKPKKKSGALAKNGAP